VQEAGGYCRAASTEGRSRMASGLEQRTPHLVRFGPGRPLPRQQSWPRNRKEKDGLTQRSDEDPPVQTAPGLPPRELAFLPLTLSYDLVDGPVDDPNPGSIWHGAWGKALDRVGCAVRQETCHGCWMVAQCPSVALGATKAGQAGPVAEAPPTSFVLGGMRGLDGSAGGRVEIDLTLLVPATLHLPTLVLAAEEVGRAGLGKSRRRLHLREIAESSRLAHPTRLRVANGPLSLPSPRDWTHLSPLPTTGRIRLGLPDGAILIADRQRMSELTLPALVRLIRRRVRLLCDQRHLDAALPSETALVQEAHRISVLASSSRTFHASRWSSRQRQRHPQRGLAGFLEVRGESLAGIEPWLRIAQVTGVGKGTSLGLGRLEISSLS